MGRPGTKKPRAILVKFKDLTVRDKVWYSKTSLKGTGVTVSEFLTKQRHETFLAGRQRFGIAKCWSRDGVIIVIGPDGARHRITTLSELKAIPISKVDIPGTSAMPAMVETHKVAKPNKDFNQRPKRTFRK